MGSKIFEVMKLLEARSINYSVERPSPLELLITARLIGKRVEIGIDESDAIDVCVFLGDDSSEAGMDAVLKAIEEDE